MNTLDTSRHVLLAHGGGGQLTDQLVTNSVFARLNGASLNDLLDSAVMTEHTGRPALTIDSYVVQPLFFPGGDIGRLAVSGTVNDLAVCGAKPAGLALGLILEEGLDRQILERVMDSISATAQQAGIAIVTGDTKVIDREKGVTRPAGLYISTAGVGFVPPGRRLHPDLVRPNDVVIVSGTIADHGLTVMLAREMPEVKSVLTSDVAPLNGLIEHLLAAVPGVVFMRDPTRAGLAGAVSDLATRTGYRIVLEDESIPIRPQTRHAAEMLGLDPLDVANEGKIVLVVHPGEAERALQTLREHPLGRDAAIIGTISAERDAICELRTSLGGWRILQKPYGEQLPRIC